MGNGISNLNYFLKVIYPTLVIVGNKSL